MADPSSVLGQQVGPYRIASFLGDGGMAQVFIGEHEAIGRQVAIKVLLDEMCQRPDVVERFMNEARALGRINHPGVVEIFDVGRLPGGRVCLVMELLRGEPLSRMVQRRGRLSVAEAVSITSQVADAIAAAHERKIIHRDLKPDNVFVLSDAGELRVKVLDFGVAKLQDGAGAVATATKTALGTAAYMAPEQFKSSRQVDARADVYALGCMLFELLTGAPPYPAPNLGLQMMAHATKPIPVASAANPEVPAALDGVIAQMLAKTPETRFGSMAAVRNALAAATGLPLPVTPQAAGGATGTMPVSGPPPAGSGGTEIVGPEARGGRGLLIAIVILIVVGAGIAALVALT